MPLRLCPVAIRQKKENSRIVTRKAGFIISDKSNAVRKGFFYDLWCISGKKIYTENKRTGRQKKKMGCVYFVRHGQTVWNVENKICGATDIALTELGHQQAIETGKMLLEQGIQADEILYSPLIRAAETARHISEITGIPGRMESRLKEQNYGKWESTARDGLAFKKAKEDFCCRYEGGESMLQLAQRIYNLLDEIKEEADRKTYILVAHNGIARVVNSYFYEMTNQEYAAFGVKNCAVVRYDF